jgi:hypothetical protein
MAPCNMEIEGIAPSRFSFLRRHPINAFGQDDVAVNCKVDDLKSGG